MNDTMDKKRVDLLYKELSYQIRGAAIEIRKNYGSGHKEVLYQRAFAEELSLRRIKYEREKPIKVYSPKTRKVIGSYQPDFIIEDRIIVELKALEQLPQKMTGQLYSYLRNSAYELGFLINFGSDGADIKRVIYTNDRKKHIQPKTEIQPHSQ
jgi:GxxExxY protein